jgi:hypothetical protein
MSSLGLFTGVGIGGAIEFKSGNKWDIKPFMIRMDWPLLRWSNVSTAAGRPLLIGFARAF